jgi:hypothetical protein
VASNSRTIKPLKAHLTVVAGLIGMAPLLVTQVMKGEFVMMLKSSSQMVKAGCLPLAVTVQASEPVTHDDEPFDGVAAG